jgi:hypothetical protein
VKVEECAAAVHAGARHFDGSPKLRHLFAVSELTARQVDVYCQDRDVYEHRYYRRVCRAAGLLHEAMGVGASFESLTDAADEASAKVVAELTPDLRMARPKRLIVYANQVGLASAWAQLVVLADLRCNAACFKCACVREGLDLLRERVEEARAVLQSLGKLQQTRGLAPVLQALVVELREQEKEVKRRIAEKGKTDANAVGEAEG